MVSAQIIKIHKYNNDNNKNVVWLVGWLGFMVYINLCRLLNTKSIFKQIISSISNNSV